MSYDNACKFLAESAPADFLRCFFSVDTTDIQVLKTELTVEPIRADSVSFLRTASQIQHLEFETLPYSDPPIPLRMLDYYTRLKRQYRCEIEQLVIFLKQTTSELVFVDEYTDTNTRHRYRVIRLWEQDPAPFLATPALLPLAPLTRTDSPVALLEQVAAEIATISEEAQRRNISACAQILAGLRHEKDLIGQLFREDIMKESVIYQDIIQEGRQQGKQEEARLLIVRQLNRRFRAIDPQLQQRIQALSIPQLEELGEALLDFSTVTDLVAWLDEHQP